ncbi:MAG: MarR family transcriptional regulator [Geminicoccaceae bacterium]
MPYRLSVLSSRISATLARRYETRFGVTIPQWRVMAVLGQHRLLSAGEVAARTRMDKAKVSRTIAVMERKGLLHRTIEPRDLRMVRLELTPEGQGVYREIAAMALDWERDLLAGLRPAALAGLESAISDLQERLDRLAPDEASGGEAVEP